MTKNKTMTKAFVVSVPSMIALAAHAGVYGRVDRYGGLDQSYHVVNLEDGSAPKAVSGSDGVIRGGYYAYGDYGVAKVGANVSFSSFNPYLLNQIQSEAGWDENVSFGKASSLTVNLGVFGDLAAGAGEGQRVYNTGTQPVAGDGFSAFELLFQSTGVAKNGDYFHSEFIIDGMHSVHADIGVVQINDAFSAALSTESYTSSGDVIGGYTHYFDAANFGGNYAFTIPIAAGVTNDISVSATCSADAGGDHGDGGDKPGTSSQGVGACNFSHSIYWNGITDARDANGNKVILPANNSPSGFDYRYSSPLNPHPLVPVPTVPAPPVAALFGIMAALTAIGRRR